MAASTQTQTGIYKGREYIVEFVGETKFGRRAKLAFMDRSKEFWVAADTVTVIGLVGRPGQKATAPQPAAPTQSRTRRYCCEECGDWVDPGTRCWETGMTH